MAGRVVFMGPSQGGYIDSAQPLHGLHFHRQFCYAGLSEESNTFLTLFFPSTCQYAQPLLDTTANWDAR